MSPSSKAKATLRREIAVERLNAPGRLNRELSAHRNTRAEFDSYKYRMERLFRVGVDRVQTEHKLLACQVRIDEVALEMIRDPNEMATRLGFEISHALWKHRR